MRNHRLWCRRKLVLTTMHIAIYIYALTVAKMHLYATKKPDQRNASIVSYSSNNLIYFSAVISKMFVFISIMIK